MGYGELRVWQDAWDAVEEIEPEDRRHPDVANLRLGIFVGLKKWESVAMLAKGMLEAGSTFPPTYLLGAYGVRRSRSLAEALAFLLRGEDYVRDHPVFHYNAASYLCQLGEVDGAKPNQVHMPLLRRVLVIVAQLVRGQPKLRLEAEGGGVFFGAVSSSLGMRGKAVPAAASYLR